MPPDEVTAGRNTESPDKLHNTAPTRRPRHPAENSQSEHIRGCRRKRSLEESSDLKKKREENEPTKPGCPGPAVAGYWHLRRHDESHGKAEGPSSNNSPCMRRACTKCLPHLADRPQRVGRARRNEGRLVRGRVRVKVRVRVRGKVRVRVAVKVRVGARTRVRARARARVSSPSRRRRTRG